MFLINVKPQTFDFYDKGGQAGVGESRFGAYCPNPTTAGQTSSWLVSC